ncbi:MAG: tetratricopeptide repeat protein [Anaerolineae bacterium]|nr:tetratricopeptide repeat protein [Anaerolineae bacterium]
MPDDLYIRRDRSSLGRGLIFGPQRRRGRPWLLYAVIVALAAAGLIVWQIDRVRPIALSLVGIVTTPTPTIVQAAHEGDLAFWRGDLDASLANYRHAAALAPDDLNIAYELIRMLIYRSYSDERNAPDGDEAVRLATALQTAYPDNTRAFGIHCFALARAGRSEEAAQSCNRAISLDPGNSDAYAYLALANYDIGRLDAASEAAQEAVRLNPNSIEGNTAYAFVLTSQQRYDDALEYFVRATQINPRLVFPYFNLGATALGMALRTGDPTMYQLSIDAYDTILSMNLRNVKAYTSLCQVYLATGDRNLARDNCLTATELDDAYTRSWRWLGEVYYRNMDYELAIDAFDRCASQEQDLPPDRRQPECWYYRGLAHVQIGDCPGALPIFGDVVGWTQSTRAIELVNEGFRLCTGGVFIPTNTPEPTATPQG